MTVTITPDNVTICTVSRLSEPDFMQRSLLARSFIVAPGARPTQLKLLPGNQPPNRTKGLSEAYNEFLGEARNDDYLIFVHDDVFVHDWFLFDRLREAFSEFDVVGVAGSGTPDLRQPSWGLQFTSDLTPTGWQNRANKSGAVGHGDPGTPAVSVYGPTPAPCELLDGLFLAVNVRRLRQARVSFDTRFRFHCYDLDFCRTARAAGLRLGTWPIAVTHASAGNFDSNAWKEAAKVYLEKWAE
jgi:GT2 family glycosyltransferase